MLLLSVALLAALASPAGAHGLVRVPGADPEWFPHGPPAGPKNAAGAQEFEQAPLGFRPTNSLELALSSESAWLGYRHRFDQGDGFASLGLLVNEDDDFLLNGRMLRFGQPQSDLPLELGVGVSFYAGSIDKPDADIYAVALTGSASYTLSTDYPTSLGAQLSLAPDITTFSDGEDLIDASVRVEVELSRFATAFVGFRFLEVGVDRASDHEFDDRLHAGVRIGF